MDEGSGAAVNKGERTTINGEGSTAMDRGGRTTLEDKCGIAVNERSGATVYVGASMDEGISMTEIPFIADGIFMDARASMDEVRREEGGQDEFRGDEDRNSLDEVESMEEIGASMDKRVGFPQSNKKELISGRNLCKPS
jgi:hypothetical protein